MTLYLTVFLNDVEAAGVLVGHYSDFAYFREAVIERLGRECFPLLLEHSDCDGSWDVADLAPLQTELTRLSDALAEEPPFDPVGAFEHTAEYRTSPRSMLECFHTVDGSPLVTALLDLCRIALRAERPILFQ